MLQREATWLLVTGGFCTLEVRVSLLLGERVWGLRMQFVRESKVSSSHAIWKEDNLISISICRNGAVWVKGSGFSPDFNLYLQEWEERVDQQDSRVLVQFFVNELPTNQLTN